MHAHTSPSVEAADRYDSAALCLSDPGGGRDPGLWRPPLPAWPLLLLPLLALLVPVANETEAAVADDMLLSVLCVGVGVGGRGVGE